MPFCDHFSPVSHDYAAFRPVYPELLFAWLASIAPARRLAWTLYELLGYIRTWSATARYVAAIGTDPVLQLGEQLRTCWGREERRRCVSWPLVVLAGQA